MQRKAAAQKLRAVNGKPALERCHAVIDNIHTHTPAGNLGHIVPGAEAWPQDQAPQICIAELRAKCHQSKTDGFFSNSGQVQATPVVRHHNLNFLTNPLEGNRDTALFRLAQSQSFNGRFNAVVDRIAQQVQQRFGQPGQNISVHHDVVARDVQYHLLGCGAGSLRNVPLQARRHGSGRNQACCKKLPVLVSQRVTFVPQHSAGLGSIRLDLLDQLLSVLHSFADAAGQHMQRVITVKLQRVKVSFFLLHPQSQCLATNHGFQLAQPVSQLLLTAHDCNQTIVGGHQQLRHALALHNRLSGTTKHAAQAVNTHAQGAGIVVAWGHRLSRLTGRGKQGIIAAGWHIQLSHPERAVQRGRTGRQRLALSDPADPVKQALQHAFGVLGSSFFALQISSHLLQGQHGAQAVPGHGRVDSLALAHSLHRIFKNIFQTVRQTANTRQPDDVATAFEGMGDSLRFQHVRRLGLSSGPALQDSLQLLQLLGRIQQQGL